MRYFIIFLLSITVMMGQVFQSKEERVNVLELFTSEGCSSCPPAETWVNLLKKEEGVFKTFIPLVFHVSYWNSLGWVDMFSHKDYDARQRWYASLWNSPTVYTPEFVLNGKEYRDWFSTKKFPTIKEKKVGILHADLQQDSLEISWKSNKIVGPLHVNIAVLGFGSSVEIMNGENAGKTLRHDFTVLGWDHHDFRGETARFNLPTLKKDTTQKAVVIWLNNEKGEIIQAVGDYLQ